MSITQTVSPVDCKSRHARLWKAATAVVALLVIGIGWAMTASLAANSRSLEATQNTHRLETTFERFAGRQEEFNKHTTKTLERIDDKVDRIWRKNGGSE